MRARAEIEVDDDNGREAIVVTELPYQVNKARLIEKIAELVKEKKLEGISELRDESDKDGMRIYIEVKRGESAEVVLNNLYQQTPMESVFGINMVALVDGRPQLLNLKQMLEAFVRHRREVVTRRTIFELRKARARAHILEGLTVALANIDEMIELIKTSENPAEARGAHARAAWEPGWSARCWAPPAPRPRAPRTCRPASACSRTATSCPRSRPADPGDAPAPPDRAGAGEADRRVPPAARHHPRPDRDPREPGRAAGGDPRRAAQSVKEEFGDARRSEIRAERGGPRHPRPDRARGRGGDAVARRLRQAPAGTAYRAQRAAAAAAMPRRPRKRTSSTSCGWSTPTTPC
jgi:hypothetical protein